MLGHAVARNPAPALRNWSVARQVRIGPIALGNALGSSLAEAASSSGDYRGQGTSASPYVDPNTGEHIVFGKPYEADPAGVQAFVDAFAGGLGDGSMPPRDTSNDILLAAGPGFTGLGMDRLSLGDRRSDAELEKLSRQAEAKDRIAYMADTIAMLKAGLSGAGAAGGGANAAWVASQNQATSDLYASGAGDVREYVELVAPAPLAAIAAEELAPLAPVTLDLQPLDIQVAAGPTTVTSPRPSVDLGSPLFNPGAGLGVYLGAQSATNAMYTRSPAAGPYGRIAGTVPGYQAHHLNQDAVYRASIPYRSGQSILLRGNAFVDAGSPHFEAHASLETWWGNYREDGPLYGQRPTNAEYGRALQQSLLDGGMSPNDAAQYAEVARQQRLASGRLDAARVPRIPGPINQPGTNVVDADLWAARGLAKNLAVVGRGAMVVGAAVDGYSLYSQYQQSVQTGNYTNTYREGVRIAGGWAGAAAVGTAGAEFGAGFGMAFTPVGAVIGGFVGGVIGGAIGYFGGSYASVGIATDVGLLPPGTPQ
jgi:hypothetical protein